MGTSARRANVVNYAPLLPINDRDRMRWVAPMPALVGKRPL